MRLAQKYYAHQQDSMPPMTSSPILTIGHSTRTIEELVGLLQAHGVQVVVDIRTIPRSRRNPQFNQETLHESLRKSGIDYVRLPALGGLRHPKRDSKNKGWRNKSFQGFADYMQTPDFDAGIKELIKLAQTARTAIMCAEVVPWRCHRSLVADALLVRGIQVEHVITLRAPTKHSVTKFAHVDGEHITYPEGSA